MIGIIAKTSIGLFYKEVRIESKSMCKQELANYATEKHGMLRSIRYKEVDPGISCCRDWKT